MSRFQLARFAENKSASLPNFLTSTNSHTEAAVGRIWYLKRKYHLELYTAAGFQPVDTTRWLKPLTKYMLEKYILRKRIAAIEK